MVRRCSQRQLEALRRGREKLRHKRTKKTTNWNPHKDAQEKNKAMWSKYWQGVMADPRFKAALNR